MYDYLSMVILSDTSVSFTVWRIRGICNLEKYIRLVNCK